MKIIINNDTEKIVLTDERLDNLNYVDISVADCDNDYASVTMPIDDLYAAISAFIKKRDTSLKRDKHI